MKTYHLTWNKEDEQWELSPQGTKAKAIARDDGGEIANKEEAIQFAAKLLKLESRYNDYPISLRIHNKDGSFSKSDGERTYGADPESEG